MEKIFINPFLTHKEKDWLRSKSKIRKLTPDTKKYLEKHPVIFSMTTSPIRLRKIGASLYQILNFPYTKEIHINLPVLYRNKEPYAKTDIDFIQHMSDKIKIFRVEKDIGPLTKILPTIERFQKKRNNSIVLSIDDDIFYPQELLYELCHYSHKYPKCIFGGSGFNFEKFYPDCQELYSQALFPYKWMRGCYQVDLVEGFGCIAYRPKLFDINLVLKLNSLSLDCKLSDDLTISYMLFKKKVAKFIVDNSYFEVDKNRMKPFSYGELDDALHKGGGTNKITENANIIKYKKCLETILNN